MTVAGEACRRRVAAHAAVVVVCTVALGCAGGQRPSGPSVRDLQIDGTHGVSAGDVRSRILTARTGWWPFATARPFDPYTWRTDLQRIVRYYQARGYYQARVLGSVVRMIAPDAVDIEVKVAEGAPTRIRQVRVEGVAALAVAEAQGDGALSDQLVRELPLRVGDVFEERRWEQAKETSLAFLREHGHALAEVEGQALVDVDTHLADLTLKLAPGPRYRFGGFVIRWSGQAGRAPAEWIVEQARQGIGPDSWFSDRALGRVQRFVSRMGLFASVRVSLGTPDPVALRVPIVIDVMEAPLHTLRLGGGAGVDQIRNEARLIGEYTDRDFFGGLRRLTVGVRVGWAFIPNVWAVLGNRTSLAPKQGPFFVATAELEQPRLLERPSLKLRGTLLAQRWLEQAFDLVGARGTVGVVWQPHPDLTLFPSYNLEGDRLNAIPTVVARNAPLTLGCRSNPCFVWVSYLDESITFDRRDNILEPRTGYYLALGLQQGGGPLFGNFDYFRALPEARGYASFGLDRELTLAARVRAGALVPWSGGPDSSPISRRFFAGGSDSMRGFNYRRLSPALVANVPVQGGTVFTTVPIGGNGLFEASLEARYRIASSFLVAAFLDMGMVPRSWADASPRDMSYAVGLGVRWLSPIGPIRLDVARRLNLGRPPPVFELDGARHPYTVNTSCFGIGGTTGSPEVPDGSCVLHLSIGEAF